MKKLYCYLKTSQGYTVFEYTDQGTFLFHSNYATESEANKMIHKLSV